jgi:hydroxyacylglutathione hydrolase
MSEKPVTNLHVFRTLTDNQCFLLWREGSTKAVIIDPAEERAALNALNAHGLELSLILNTHHHHDHVDGNLALQQRFNAPIFCSSFDFERVPGASRGLKADEHVLFNGLEFTVLAMSGHTLGQVAYYFESLRTVNPSPGTVAQSSIHPGVFAGDTVFAMGCGRLFEGSAAQMWTSLSRILSLPQSTRLYFGHEYTRLNAPFARSIEPENWHILERLEQAESILARHPNEIVPAPSLAHELLVNPFFRISDASFGLQIRERLGLTADVAPSEVFRQLRLLRDSFIN